MTTPAAADTKETPKGISCECGESSAFPPYVYAHWDERLTYTCPGCGTKHSILQGRAQPIGRAKS